MRARAAIVVLPTAFAACGAFDEASQVVADAGGAEAGVVDAGDAGDSGSMPATRDGGDFCKDARFCDDFERATTQGDWPQFEANGDTVVLPVSAEAPHGAQYLQIFVTPKATPPVWPHARFVRPVRPDASRIVDVRFHFRAPVLAASHHANLTSLSIHATPPLAFVLTVHQNDVVAFVTYDNASYTEVGRRARRVNQWDTAHAVLDLGTSTISADLEDGAVVTSSSVTPGKDQSPDVTLELGPGYSDFETSYTLDFDALEVRAP